MKIGELSINPIGKSTYLLMDIFNNKGFDKLKDLLIVVTILLISIKIKSKDFLKKKGGC